EAFALGQIEAHPVHRAHDAARGIEDGSQALDFEHRRHTGTAPMRTRGSKPSRTASAKRFAARTRANMKKKAAASDHHTIGSRPISRRAALIMVPKLMVAGSTPTPT